MTGRIWGVSSYVRSANLADFCLRWGLILDWGNPDTLRVFQGGIDEGDLVVLHSSCRYVWGVGEVVGPGSRRPDLADVYGVDAQHFRRVRWLWRAEVDDPKVFPHGILRDLDRIEKLPPSSVTSWVEQITADPGKHPPHALIGLPAESNEDLSREALATALAARGMPAPRVEALRQALEEVGSVAQTYETLPFPAAPLDRLSFLVVPLLKALGWTARHVNIQEIPPPALVKLYDGGLSATNHDPAAFLSVQWRYPADRAAASELLAYARRYGESSCRCAILTDGIHYGVYEHLGDGRYPARPSAWLNLLRLRERYPLMECEGAVRAVELMSESTHD